MDVSRGPIDGGVEFLLLISPMASGCYGIEATVCERSALLTPQYSSISLLTTVLGWAVAWKALEYFPDTSRPRPYENRHDGDSRENILRVTAFRRRRRKPESE